MGLGENLTMFMVMVMIMMILMGRGLGPLGVDQFAGVGVGEVVLLGLGR
jgi:hypothetical protein